MAAEDTKQWESARQKEYDSIIKNDTWTFVPRPKDMKVIKCCWVLCIKDVSNLYKAHFVPKALHSDGGKTTMKPLLQSPSTPPFGVHPLCSSRWSQKCQDPPDGHQ